MATDRIINLKVILIYIFIFMIFLLTCTSIANANSEDRYNEEYIIMLVNDININSDESINKLTKELNDKKYETDHDVAIINGLLAYAYENKGEFAKCEDYFLEAARQFRNINDIDSVINIYMYLVSMYNRNGDFSNSLIYSNSIVGILDEEVGINNEVKAKAKVLTLSTLINSCIYFGLDDVKDYVKELDEYLAINKNYETGLSLEVRFFYYMSSKDFIMARSIVEESKILDNKMEKDFYLSIIDIAKGDFEDCYKKISILKKYFSEREDALKLAKVFLIEGAYYKEINNYEKALESFELSYNKFLDLDTSQWTIRVLNNIIDLKIDTKDESDLLKYIEVFERYTEKFHKEEKGLISKLLETKENLLVYEMKEISKEKELIKVKNIYISKMINIISIIAIILAIIIIVLIININRRKKSEENLKEVMSKDYLTNAYTREYAYEKINEFMSRNIRFSMALLDLDDFKCINDNYGHVTGDAVLKDVSSVVIKYLSSDDVFGRFGGEEFIIIFKDKDEYNCIEICERIREEVSNINWNKEGLSTTISIGIKEYNGDDIITFTNSVDELLYKAKHSGKNKTCI